MKNVNITHRKPLPSALGVSSLALNQGQASVQGLCPLRPNQHYPLHQYPLNIFFHLIMIQGSSCDSKKTAALVPITSRHKTLL